MRFKETIDLLKISLSNIGTFGSMKAYKKAIINIKNNDDKCFMWCVLAQLYPVAKNAERVSNYNKEEYQQMFE